MKKALVTASVASMIDQFNRDNIRTLQELGYEVTIACNFRDGNTTSVERMRAFRAEMKENRVTMLHVPIPRSITKVSAFFQSFRILRERMAEERFELVHCQSPIGGVVARLAARPFRKKGMKVMYYAHGFHFFQGAGLVNWLAYYGVEAFCSRFTDCQITLNQEDYRNAKQRLWAKQVVHMPGVGVDLDAIDSLTVNREAKLEELGLPPSKKIVLSVGELSVRKNVVTTLDAFAKARPEDAVLVFCGLGPKKEELDAKVREYGIGEKVFFLGYRTDVLEIFKISDLFLFPSKQEGLPVVLMQAMAVGLPVLCSNVRGNRDLIVDGKGGLLYEPFDVNGYAEGVTRLLCDEGLAEEMGAYNQKAARKYDVKRVNERMRRVYLRLLA